jgi:hypothetical protein
MLAVTVVASLRGAATLRRAALRRHTTQPRQRLSCPPRPPPPPLSPHLASAARSTLCFAARGRGGGRIPILPFIVQGVHPPPHPPPLLCPQSPARSNLRVGSSVLPYVRDEPTSRGATAPRRPAPQSLKSFSPWRRPPKPSVQSLSLAVRHIPGRVPRPPIVHPKTRPGGTHRQCCCSMCWCARACSR